MKQPFPYTFLPVTTVTSGEEQVAAPGLSAFTVQIVNVCLVGELGSAGQWVLVDAGMPHSADEIICFSAQRYGTKPQAIILTHGHFDHVGAITRLLEEWEGIPVYAHELELPYLHGAADYPPADPTVDGGLITEMSPLFPNHGIDLGERVAALPAGGVIPEMPGWRWIHTPGHTPGHISLFRDRDRALIAGDAFVTVKQESLYKVITQELEISGPPKYFTTDWQAARESVKKLEALKPTAAVTGHGRPMTGSVLARELARLAADFEHIALPEKGRFVHPQS